MMEIISRSEAKTWELKRYFTGKMCKYGHVAERWVNGCTCVRCGKDKQIAWNLANPEKVRERWKRKHAANSEKRNAARRAYRAANLEKEREHSRRRYAEKIRAEVSSDF